MICRDEYEKDPFLESDHLLELSTLIEKSGMDSCSIDEFVAGDDDLPTCVFFNDLTDHSTQEEDDDSDEDVIDITVQTLEEVEPNLQRSYCSHRRCNAIFTV